jgi:putative phosphonate metabolism protein
MSPQPRYAIYFVPGADSTLYRFGASVLGYDTHRGTACPFVEGAEADWSDFTREPRVYGFHATLKPPFHLADNYGEADLTRAVADFTANRAAVLIGELAVRELGSFIALVPQAPRPQLNSLAEACVRDFDRFRQPMSEQELARRLTPNLTDRQTVNLARWGYPYVCEDFRFHMTLTGALFAQKRDRALRFLREKFDQQHGMAAVIADQLVIARQSGPMAPFQVISVTPLGQSPYRPFAYSC